MDCCGKRKCSGVIPVLVAVAAALFACWMAQAPRPLPASAPLDVFSAERAHRHIAAVCTEPMPAGSIHNDFACQYIQDELERLGVETELIHHYERTGDRRVSRWRAVLGRIRGTAPTRAFAVDAHFDSVAWGSGAADDWAGIAAMLEAARALKAGAPLMNDVIFVFADQEEFNMGGARAYRNHPWFEETGVMLGLETRGTSGPALMFETSPNNGFVVREMARSSAGARSNSVMYDFYARMPFNSDFNHYKHHVAGLNVAFIDNFDYYHTSLDNPENISLASLQHHGNYTLGLARHFGSMPLDDCYAPDVNYFNTIGAHMVVYPQSWGWPLALSALAFFVALLVFGFASGRLAWRGVVTGMGAIVVASLVAAIPIGLVSFYVFVRFREAALYQNNVYSFGFTLIGLAVFVGTVAVMRRWARPQEFLAGALVIWAAALILMQAQAPGGANLCLVPLVFGSLYLLVLLVTDRDEHLREKALPWSVVLALPPIMFIAPMAAMSFYAITVLASALLVPTVLLTAALITPQLCLPSKSTLWKTASVLTLAGAVIVVVAYLGTRPSPTSPRLNSLAYGVNFDAGQAYWMSTDSELDEWTELYIPRDTPRQSLEEFLPHHQNHYFKASAPMPPFAPPVLDIREDRIENGRRILECRLDSPRDAQRLWLRVVSDTHVYGAHILGHDLTGGERDWEALFEILPREGANLRLEVDPESPLSILVREISFELPEFDMLVPRPNYMIAEPNRTLARLPLHSEYTYSRATVDLGQYEAPSEESVL